MYLWELLKHDWILIGAGTMSLWFLTASLLPDAGHRNDEATRRARAERAGVSAVAQDGVAAMKITDFARLAAKAERGKVNLPIAQISEVLRVANDLTYGLLYAVIRWL